MAHLWNRKGISLTTMVMKQVNKRHPCCKEHFRSCKRNINPLYIPHLVPVGKRVQLMNQPVTTLNLTKVLRDPAKQWSQCRFEEYYERKTLKLKQFWQIEYVDPRDIFRSKKVRCPVPVSRVFPDFFPKQTKV